VGITSTLSFLILISGNSNYSAIVTFHERSFLATQRNYGLMCSWRSMYFRTEFFDVNHDYVVLVEIATRSHKPFEKSVVVTRSFPCGVTKSVLTLLPVEHTSALDQAVNGNQLVKTSNMGQSKHLGGRSNRLGQRLAENLSSLLREGPRQEQCA
jgi:hypothetical protein